MQEDKGFAMYLSGTVKESKKITFEGIVYVIEKKGGKWVASQKVDPVENTISFGESHFPQFGGENQFPDKPKKNLYWDFLDEKGENVKSLADGEEATRQGRWKWIGEGNKEDGKKLEGWSPNLSDWCKHFFGDEEDGLAITSLVSDDDATGKWETYAN